MQTFCGIKKEFPLRCREYFENLFNPTRETPTDTCDTIVCRKEEVFKLTEVATVEQPVIRGLKSGKAAKTI